MRTSWLAAAGVALALAAWMASGLLAGDEGPEGNGGGDDADGPAAGQGPAPMRVEVAIAEPRPERRTLTLRGELVAARTATLRAETTAAVAALPVRRGDRVAEGAPLVRLDAGAREADLAAARAQLRSARAEREAAESLGASGLQSRLRSEQAIAAASLAEAEVGRLEAELDRTVVRAPFAGLVEALPLEVGELVQPGEPVATLVDDSAFDAVASAPQQSAAELVPGRAVEIRPITGGTLAGTLSWVSTVADPATRSFRVEARVDDAAASPGAGLPGGRLASGTSATLVVPLEEVDALFLSPSTLALGPDGELGVKALDAEDRVTFRPVELLRTSLDGAWVTGVAAGTRIVTLGQGFVGVGERVIPSPATTGAGPRGEGADPGGDGAAPARAPEPTSEPTTGAATGTGPG